MGVEWRYLPKGTVKHALRYADDRVAVCGVGPHWSAPDAWYGTGSQAEYETAAGVAGVSAVHGTGPAMTDDHRCEPVVDDDGTVLGRARICPDLDERGRRALVEIVKAAIRLQAEWDAADPEAAAERARRQEAMRARRWRGEAE